MNIRKLILDRIEKDGKIKAADIVKATGFSREYINRFFRELRNEGKIILIGKTTQAIYVKAEKEAVLEAKKEIKVFNKTLENNNLSEDTILDEAKRETGIFADLDENVSNIINYGFTEMLNNAIEHSESSMIRVSIQRGEDVIKFEVIDRGIGIFNNIMQKRHLKNELEAIQDLLKGKQSTAPLAHTGEGVFFTSKVADTLVIESSKKKMLFNNVIDDFFVQDIKSIEGTRVIFAISIGSKRVLSDVFKEFSGESYEFDKTKVAVKLYKMGTLYISRSQARRVMTGLEKFRKVILDFNHIKTIGQAFADEIFRVWKNHNPGIEIVSQNTNENINFMIQRALGASLSSQQTLL